MQRVLFVLLAEGGLGRFERAEGRAAVVGCDGVGAGSVDLDGAGGSGPLWLGLKEAEDVGLEGLDLVDYLGVLLALLFVQLHFINKPNKIHYLLSAQQTTSRGIIAVLQIYIAPYQSSFLIYPPPLRMNAPAHLLTDMTDFFRRLSEDISGLAKETARRFFKNEQAVEKAVQPHRFPELPKCKWQTMYERRMKKEQEKEERLQQYRAEVEKCRRERIESMQFLPNQQLQKYISKSINDFLARQTQENFSFLLPQIVSIKSPKYLHSFCLEVIYQKVQEQLRKRQKGKHEVQNHFSIFKNEIDLHGNDNFFFQFANAHKLDDYRRSLEHKLLAIRGQIDKQTAAQNKKLKNVELVHLEEQQQILHYLQIARIYRYDFCPRIEKYLFEDAETIKFLKHLYPVANSINFGLALGKQFELSDIGLFTPKSTIPKREQEETYCYWYERMQLHYAFKRSSEDQEVLKMKQSIREIIKKTVELKAEKEYKQLQMGELIKWLYSFLDSLQNQLIQQDNRFREKFNSTLTNLGETRERILSKYSLCSENAKSYLCLLLPPGSPITYKNYNLLRMFCKWRKFDGDHPLQVTNMVSRLSNGSTIEEIASEIQNDYMSQIIPIRLFLIQKANSYRERYEALQPQLNEEIFTAKEEQEKRAAQKAAREEAEKAAREEAEKAAREEAEKTAEEAEKTAEEAKLDNRFETPQKRPTRIEVNAPRKKNRQQLSSEKEATSSSMQESVDWTEMEASDLICQEPSPMETSTIEEKDNDSGSSDSEELELDSDLISESPEEKKQAKPAVDMKALRNKLQNMSNAAKEKKVIELD